MIALRRAVFLVLFVVAGCAPLGPPFASVAATIPPVPQGMARIYFYRWLEPYETLAPTPAYLNGAPVGVTQPGAVLYRDVAPGQYLISVRSDEAYPNQFKTVTLKAGDIVYARIESLQSWSSCGSGGGGFGDSSTSGCRTTFVVVIVDPAVAHAEIGDLRFVQG